jgi:DNA adenine methylase
MTIIEQKLKSPFPYFGGKSRIAHEVWARFGDVPNYVEPFAGSLAVLLARPTPPRIETVNDIDCFLTNFWRALCNDPDGVAKWADYPVSEIDLHARHKWLVNQHEFIEAMRSEPDYYDVKIAGWWVWGISAWIGNGWCRDAETRQLPCLGSGVHRVGIDNLHNYFAALSARLRRVRVCCGDWKRVCTPAVTFGIGLTGVFLDPPYKQGGARKDKGYAAETHDVTNEVQEWCIVNQDNPKMRIAVCGFEGEYALPGWECLAWKRVGGYGSQKRGQGSKNRKAERVWFSPHCLKQELLS